jgi:hypothetical protein
LQELPDSIKEEVLYKEFGGLVDTITMLKECDDNEFVWATVQLS